MIRLRAWWFAAGLLRRVLLIVIIGAGIYFGIQYSGVIGLLTPAEEAKPEPPEWTPPTEPPLVVPFEVEGDEGAGADSTFVHVDLSNQTGQIEAEVVFPPDQILSAPEAGLEGDNRDELSDLLSTGGTSFIVPGGECGFNSICDNGLPSMFDLDEVGQRRFTEETIKQYGILPRDTEAWYDARRVCYESPIWFPADCNLELVLGQYGTLVADYRIDSACLSQQYLGRLALPTEIHPDQAGTYGWWLCESSLWNTNTGPDFIKSCVSIVEDATHCEQVAHVFGYHLDVINDAPNNPNSEPTLPDAEIGQDEAPQGSDLSDLAVTAQRHQHEPNVSYAAIWDRCNATRFMAEAALLSGRIQTFSPVGGTCEAWRRPPSTF